MGLVVYSDKKRRKKAKTMKQKTERKGMGQEYFVVLTAVYIHAWIVKYSIHAACLHAHISNDSKKKTPINVNLQFMSVFSMYRLNCLLFTININR